MSPVPLSASSERQDSAKSIILKSPIKYRDLARLISDIVTWPKSKVFTQERSLSIKEVYQSDQSDKGKK